MESIECRGGADCFVFDWLRLDLVSFGMVAWVEDLWSVRTRCGLCFDFCRVGGGCDYNILGLQFRGWTVCL